MTPRDEAEIESLLLGIGGSLDAARTRRGLTLDEWAESAHISRRGLRFVSMKTDPKITTLAKAARGLGLRLRVTLENAVPGVPPEHGKR